MIEPKNLLIVRTDRIGDVILSLPLAQLVKRKFPNCRITYLVRGYTTCLVENHPFIDSHLILREKDGRVSIMKNVKELQKYKFDSCVIVYPTFYTALIIFLSQIKNRIGTGYRWYSFLFNYKIFQHRKYAERHELEYNINLLSAFGINETVNPQNVNFNLRVSKESDDKIETLLSEYNIDRSLPIVLLHPGSGGSAVDLPLNKFIELVEMIKQKTETSIIVTGLESEKELCNCLVVNKSIKNFAGLLTLSDLIALINRAKLFVSNSTGPIHIAAALNVHTIGFYPKILSCSKKRWGPYSTKTKIFEPEIECSNCTREQCEQLNCMNSIKISEVFSEAQNLLNFKENHGENNA